MTAVLPRAEASTDARRGGIGPDHPSLYPARRWAIVVTSSALGCRGGRRRDPRRVVPLRRVDAREHHPAR